MVLFLVGLGLLALLKENRTRQAWAVFLPWIVLLPAADFLVRIISPSSAFKVQMGLWLETLAATWAILWLLGERIGGRRRVASFFLALLVGIVVGIVPAYGYFDFASAGNAIAYLIVYTFLMLATLLVLTVTGFLCRKQYTDKRFLLFLVLCGILIPVFLLTIYMGIGMMLVAQIRAQFLTLMMRVVITGGILGGALVGVMLPYLLLTFTTGFYRRRFYRCLRLAGMSEVSEMPASP